MEEGLVVLSMSLSPPDVAAEMAIDFYAEASAHAADRAVLIVFVCVCVCACACVCVCCVASQQDIKDGKSIQDSRNAEMT